ncbi:MAG TPA: glutamate decarboxylase [Gaiellaceae bacterium]|nr:glutamate decarboxylase [Gaiellaceae bacterium]
MPLHAQEPDRGSDDFLAIRPQFARRGEVQAVPRFRLPDDGMDPDTAYQVVHDELMLDGSARLNLATFVTTWMEPQARTLIADTLDKNMIDKDEYPQTAELERRCVSILADLWHAESARSAVGTSTIGSSEAAMLGGLALKWRWRQRQAAGGRPTDRPNLVMGSNVQVCWEKFCRYWDVEPRLVPMRDGCYHLTAEGAVERCDENTIGVVAILGSTQDGSYEPVGEIAAALDRLEAARAISVPIHVDAASGGFVAPFLDPELEWDFRVPRVQSINSSGHKYGLVYPGVGWALWRNREALPEELVFAVDYLGGETPTMAINFSRPGAQIVAQYYSFLRLGRTGYAELQAACRSTARYLADEIAALGPFELISDGSELPVLAFRLAEGVSNYTVYDVSDQLRQRGWLVPAYAFPPDLEDVHVLRIVVRNGFSRDLARLLLADLRRAIERLGRLDRPLPPIDHPGGFHH